MAKIKWASYCMLALMVIVAGKTFSAESAESAKQNIGFYESDDVTNQIPYFDNRFRLDAQLEEITLIFYRKSGTKPIILVRPDGVKYKVNNYPKDKVTWYDDRTFDMVTIKKPMPGPWQAIGDILPQSKIMIMSDISINVMPIPEVVLAGETLKMAGKLINGGIEFHNPLFSDVIELEVEFYSTNNSAYDNFGSEPVQLTTFRDDGEDLDEYMNDGIFTGEFALDFPAGEWVPVYIVKLPMLVRELRQKPIIIQRTPITISAKTTHDKLGFHQVIFSIDPTYVDPDSILLQGKFIFPDRQSESFSVIEGAGDKRIEKLPYTEPGIHRVNVSVFGKTRSGREFRLVVPEFVFNVEIDEVFPESNVNEEESKPVMLSPEEALIENKKQAALALEAELEAYKLAAEKEQEELISLIVIINGVVIIVALIVFIAFRWNNIKNKLMPNKGKKGKKEKKEKKGKKENKEEKKNEEEKEEKKEEEEKES